MGVVNDELKRLRLAAHPPLSVRAMAEQLGVTSSAYHFYESRSGFKQPYLPMDLARRIAGVLADRGVNADNVLALAGVGTDESGRPALSAGEEQLLGLFRTLSGEHRQLLLQVAVAFGAGAPASTTLHSPKTTYHHQGEEEGDGTSKS